MNIVTIAGWAAAALLAESTVSCAVRIACALFRRPERLRGLEIPDGLTLLGFLGSLLLADLAVLGALPFMPAVLGAAILFAAAACYVVAPVVSGGPDADRGEALDDIGDTLRDMRRAALSFIAEDLRVFRRDDRRPSGGPDSGPPRWASPVRARNVPHLLDDPYLGAHPGPEEVAAGLEHAEVPVPPHWERLAQVIGDYEAETDEDLAGHIAGEAAGILTVSAAIENRTENLALGRGLDPVLIEAHYDIADGFAELATRYALLVRRDHVLHGEVREWRDNGGVLPRDARGWFNAGSGDGGRAA